MKKLNVAVVMGGVSPEHEISLMSGATVLAHLEERKFHRKAAVILRNGLWALDGDSKDTRALSAVESGVRPEAALADLVRWRIDVAFLALHGPNGEDGAIQGFFQTAGIPFTGPGVEACALSMNKHQGKVLAREAGILTPKGLVFNRGEWDRDRALLLRRVEREVGFPAFVKTLRSGSSIGVSRVEGLEPLEGAFAEEFARGSEVLVEEEIRGREITCGVLSRSCSEMEVLPAVEIRPKGARFFDFESKYDAQKAEEICPASLRAGEWEALKGAALALNCRIGGRGLTRLDFILNEAGFWFLELNAIPGLTPESIVLKEAVAAGIALNELMEILVQSALEHG